ncbi:hypothetical protein C2S52_010156 [Perilla frutescens var. hirtella]|nr:hypothetical protein C2S52_010156 [Perilla frutescens var. hirtella]
MLLKRILGFGVPFLFGMKAWAAATVILVILVVSSAAHVNEAIAVWIPEHRCLKKIHSSKCDSYKCVEMCSAKPQGRGKCRGSHCICSYYCRGPP